VNDAVEHRLDPSSLDELADIVGPTGLVTDPDVLVGASRDWTGRWLGHTPALVRPATVEEVAGVVAWARRHQVPLVPQGGNTGLVGGGVPLAGEVVLSSSRLVGITDVDATSGQLTARAGATIEAVQRAAIDAGWAYGIDLASRATATVGGTIATNAGGLRVLRHGATRHQVLGVEAVLGTGARVERLGGLIKDNTGYDLAGLLCGSEGTLGFVVAARLRLVPHPPDIVTALVGYPSIGAAVEAGQSLRRVVEGLEAVELCTAAGMALVAAHLGIGLPFSTAHAAYLIVEAAGFHDPTTALQDGLAMVGPIADAAVAVDAARRADLWRYRERHTEAVSARGVPHKLDVTLPAGSLATFVETVPESVRAIRPGAETWCFGHVADGNIHVNVTGVDPRDDTVDDLVLSEVIAHGGSISAEHGIGVAKKPWLVADRGAETVDTYAAIKAALDPDGICNPGVLLP
jgi:FAD/FMN-containing dehydrogenase